MADAGSIRIQRVTNGWLITFNAYGTGQQKQSVTGSLDEALAIVRAALATEG